MEGYKECGENGGFIGGCRGRGNGEETFGLIWGRVERFLKGDF